MDATLTDEQEQIQDTTIDFLESTGGINLARRRMAGETGIVAELWDELARLDYPAMMVPTEYGGLGEDQTYATAVLEAMGRYAMPGPFPETAVLAVSLLRDLGTAAQLRRYFPPVADGDLRFSVAIYDANEPIPRTIRMEGRSDDGDLHLSGEKLAVPYAAAVDRILVAVRSPQSSGYDGISICVVDPSADGVIVTECRSLDRTRPVSTLTFDDVVIADSAVLGARWDAGDALKRAVDRFSVGICGMLIGGGREAVDRSTEHATKREQYGHPIGRFQAVKHRIVDMHVDVEAARSLTYYAAWALATDDPDARRAVAATKTYAADRLHRVFGDDIWNHGGLGFTWDHDAHIFLKQAKAWRNFLDSPERARERLIRERTADRSQE
jgi:alkylation response protein AidB-like acyl-CoA dehydrogenase